MSVNTTEIPVDPYTTYVLDLETSVDNKDHRGFDASPFYHTNDIVACCINKMQWDPHEEEYIERYGIEVEGTDKVVPIKDPLWNPLPRYVVGHNVIFDYHHLRKSGELISKLLGSPSILDVMCQKIREGEILLWDTMLVEYLLTGQQESMISLENLGEKYEVPIPKVTDVTELWKAGVRTEDIDKDLLEERVTSDVEITKQIYLKQLELVLEQGMLPFVMQQLRSLAVIAEYTWNGMYVDNKRLNSITMDANLTKAEAQAEMEQMCYVLLEEGYEVEVDYTDGITWTYIPAAIGDIDKEVPKAYVKRAVKDALAQWASDAVSSTDKLKQLIYGNENFELEVYIPHGTYKSGKKKGETKVHKCKLTFPIIGRFPASCLPTRHLSDVAAARTHARPAPKFTYKDAKLNDATVDYLLTRGIIAANRYVTNLLENLKEYRDACKIVDTFCKGIREYQYDDGCIHGNLLTCRTPTGRLTSSEPNLQNIPAGSDSCIKEVFISRWPTGKVAAVDFKQLEVIALAWKTGDPQLIEDILTGRDIHFETGKNVFGWRVPADANDDLRKKVKRVNFGIIYGAGAATVGEDIDLDDTDVRELVKSLKSRYNVAFSSNYLSELSIELNNTANRIGEHDDGRSVYRGYITQPTGRRISVDSVVPKFKKSGVDWPFTKLRNYPVQSLAYDIVSVARVMFLDKIIDHGLDGKIKMINEVHDEIVFDLVKEDYIEALDMIREEVEEEIGKELAMLFNLDLPMDLPLTLSFGWGDNWKECK